MFRWHSWCILAATVVAPSAHAEPAADVASDWRLLRQFVRDDVRVVRESEHEIAFAHPATHDTLVVAARPAERVGAYDLYRVRRGEGADARRVWVVDEARWHDKSVPRGRWADFFRLPFLKILRLPGTADGTTVPARAWGEAS